MKTLDRYILKSFVVNYLILASAMIGLIILVDFILNIDQFTRGNEAFYGESANLITLLWVILSFYAPRVLLLFIYIAGLLPITAAAFTLTQMMRSRELIAILASGISLYRVAMPLLVAGGISSMVLFIDQQLLVPPNAYSLSLRAASLKDGGQKPLSFALVPDSHDALYSGTAFSVTDQTMTDVVILERDASKLARSHVYADTAVWDAERGGWELINGRRVTHETEETTPGERIARTETLTFIKTDLDPTTLFAWHRSQFRSLLNLNQLVDLRDKPHLVDTNEIIRLIHSRFSLPVMNVLILAIGLPFFLVRQPVNPLPNAIKAMAFCLPAWAGGFIMLQLAPSGIPPALIAWLPVAIYLPIAFYLLDRMET